jgi:hypothetical protein
MVKTRIIEVELINGEKKYYPQKKMSIKISVAICFLFLLFPFGTVAAIFIVRPFGYEHFGIGIGYDKLEEAKARIDRFILDKRKELGTKPKSKKHIKYP